MLTRSSGANGMSAIRSSVVERFTLRIVSMMSSRRTKPSSSSFSPTLRATSADAIANSIENFASSAVFGARLRSIRSCALPIRTWISSIAFGSRSCSAARSSIASIERCVA